MWKRVHWVGVSVAIVLLLANIGSCVKYVDQLPPSVAQATRMIHSFARKGSVRGVVMALGRGAHPTAQDGMYTQRNAIHFALEGMYNAVEEVVNQVHRGEEVPESIIGPWMDVLGVLLRPRIEGGAGLKGWEGCGVLDAVTYRLVSVVREKLLDSLPCGRVVSCLSEFDALRDLGLHRSVTSKASGVARVLLRTSILPNPSSRSFLYQHLFPLLDLFPPNSTSISPITTHSQTSRIWHVQDITRSMGGGDVDAILDNALRCRMVEKVDAVGENDSGDGEEGEVGVVRWVDVVGGEGLTALGLACRDGLLSAVAKLLEMGANPNTGSPSCFEAARRSGFAIPPLHLDSDSTLYSTLTPPLQQHLASCAHHSSCAQRCPNGCSPPQAPFHTPTHPSYCACLPLTNYTFPPKIPTPSLPTLFPAHHKQTSIPSLEVLAKRWKGVKVRAGLVPYASTYAGAEMNATTMDLGDYITSYLLNPNPNPTLTPPLYVFDNEVLTKSFVVANSLPIPSFNTSIRQFIIGPKDSGAMPHIHDGAWNVLFLGRKLWVITPPSCAEFALLPASEWFHRVYGTETWRERCPVGVEFRFVQEAGDIVWIPRNWGHAVLNLDTTIAAAFETSRMDALLNKK